MYIKVQYIKFKVTFIHVAYNYTTFDEVYLKC